MLKTRYDSKSDIPEGLETYYKGSDESGWQLQVEGLKTSDDVNNVKKTLQRERDAHKSTRAELKQWKGLGDLEDIQNKLDLYPELETQAQGAAEATELAEKIYERKAAPLHREIDALKAAQTEYEGKVQNFEAANRNRKIADFARKAATEKKVVDTAIDDVLMYAQANFQVTEDGEVVTNEKAAIGAGLGANEWIDDMQSKKPHWWAPMQGGGATGGTGASGAGAKNPFSKDNWNMTEQGRLMTDNPEEAQQLAKQAGVKIPPV